MAKVVTAPVTLTSSDVTTDMVVGFKNSDGNRFKFIKRPTDDKFMAVALDNSSTYYHKRLNTDTLQEAIDIVQNHYGYEVFAADTLEELLSDLAGA